MVSVAGIIIGAVIFIVVLGILLYVYFGTHCYGASPNGSYTWTGTESGNSSTQSSGGLSGGSGS
jgi:hypothetical protein